MLKFAMKKGKWRQTCEIDSRAGPSTDEKNDLSGEK